MRIYKSIFEVKKIIYGFLFLLSIVVFMISACKLISIYSVSYTHLYIKHGDFGHGDECYGYILRDNQIKDYIYYRFASVYEDIDFNKAKALAYESLQYVDGRYTYYQNIMDIINK